MAVTTKQVATALRSALNVASVQAAGIASGAVYDTAAIPGASFPFVRYTLMDAGDIDTFGTRCYQWYQYLVVAHAAEDRDTGATIAAAVDAVLNRGTLSITGGTFDICYRVREIELAQPESDGKLYWQNGGIYYIGVRV